MNLLLQKGKEHLSESIFLSEKRKQILLKKYTQVHIYHHKKTFLILYFCSKKQLQSITPLLPLFFKRVDFMREIAHNQKELLIWLWPTPWKKEIPKNKYFVEDNINTGSTTTYIHSSDNGEICLWRKEELLKVLLHELIHAFRLDRNYPAPQEAHVELQAVLYHLQLSLPEKGISNKEMKHYLEKEALFGLKQASKVIQCSPGKTNILAYLVERNRLLWNLCFEKETQKSWQEKIKRKKERLTRKLLFTKCG